MQGYTTRKWSVTIPIRSTIICGHSIYSSTGRRRGGSCLGIIYIIYIIYIYIYHLQNLHAPCASEARDCVLCAKVLHWSKCHTWNSTLRTSHYTLHKPHFTLQTSSHLIWAFLTSSQLISSHAISSDATSNSSSQLFSAHRRTTRLFSSHWSSS